MRSTTVVREALGLLEESLDDPWGAITPATYDTALVELLPAADRPAENLDYLLATQNSEGSWGSLRAGPAYRIVPTLTAAVCLLEISGRAGGHSVEREDRVRVSALRGLSWLFTVEDFFSPERLPDTVAVETILPVQLEKAATLLSTTTGAERLLDDLSRAREGYRGWLKGVQRLMAVAEQGGPLPPHINHTVEVLGPALAARVVGKTDDGPVACSPAATAAVFATTAGRSESRLNYLRLVAEQHGGKQPDLAPISTFERVWITAQYLRCGIPLPDGLRSRVVDELEGTLRRDGGAGMAPGFPLDCDITSSVLTILHELGEHSVDVTSLKRFAGESAFFCYYPGERTLSPTVNAHALEALQALQGPEVTSTERDNCVSYLLDSQEADGTWSDKWHASPYYNVACCVPPLSRHGTQAAMRAVDRTRGWLVRTQRYDGTWGRWDGTAEETAYAVQTLLHLPSLSADETQAALRGLQRLDEWAEDSPTAHVHPPLWHAKELFTPHRIVAATVLSARHLGAMWRNGRSAPANHVPGQ